MCSRKFFLSNCDYFFLKRCNSVHLVNIEFKGIVVQLLESATVIEVRNLFKTFDRFEVLKGVSLSAQKGKVVALIGPSGSGKSTLLRCINLLENSQAGDILFQNQLVNWTQKGLERTPADKSQVIKIRTKLSMVFQQFNLWSHMTILQNVMEAPMSVLGYSKKQAEVKAKAYLKKVGILEKADAFPAFVSGGQQQRAAIARALCMEPAAILFDEPTSALDPELEQEVINVIKNLAAEGSTMLIVTHDMQLVKDVADKIVFLHDGKIIEEGKPKDIFKNPKTERLKRFLK